MKIKKTNENAKNASKGAIMEEKDFLLKEVEDMKNPFTPSFGTVPIVLAGRKDVMAELDYALDNVPGDPASNSIFIGARGTGKTAMLTFYSREMSSRGWVSVNVSCTKGMLEDIYQQTIQNASHLLQNAPGLSVSSAKLKAGIGAIGGELDFKRESFEANWRIRMTDLIAELNSMDVGILFTIDELHQKQEEMIQFSLIYQMWVREQRKVALFMAGLPHNVSSLLGNKQSSFLRRSSQYTFSRIPDYEVREAFVDTVRSGKKNIMESALESAIKAINGFPYMMQLVGYRSFANAGDRELITDEDIKRGIEIATRDLKTRVLIPELDETSNMGLKFLRAMSQDDKDSSIADIAERLGKDKNYVHQYKNRLLEQGIITITRRDHVAYALPGLKDCLEKYYR